MAEENSNVLTNHYDKKKIIQFFVIMVVTAIVWNLPIDTFGIDGLTIVQQRIIAIFVFATLSWLTECIPSWATSLGIITIMCLTVSDNALMPFKGENIGELMDSKHIMASFADPTIMLFLGGFILAAAATKSGLDVLLARNLIRPFGTKSENVLLGFLLITGIFSMFVSSIMSVIITFAADKVQRITFWTMGSLRGSTYQNAAVLALALLFCGTVILLHAQILNAFAVGEDNARQIGVDVKRAKLMLLIMVSVLIGVCVSVGGTIGFVGLVTPHMARMLVGPNHKRLLPASMFGGAVFLMLADLIARILLNPLELPIGVVTSFVGAIVFVVIFYQSRKEH